jgi:hypothetical protein
MSKIMFLGTAGWGVNISKAEAFTVIEEFHSKGFHLIDSATNYPINGRKKDFGLANSWLREWIGSTERCGTQVFVKIGAVDNSGGDNSNLSTQNVRETIFRLQDEYEDSVYGVGIHWDNRLDPQEILETLLTIQEMCPKSYRLGISGIKFPSLYNQSLLIGKDWQIQVKDYPGNDVSRRNYSEHFPDNPFIAYGLSHFLKQEVVEDDSVKERKYLEGIGYYFKNSSLSGFIVSPRNQIQAKVTINQCLSLQRDVV